jgi:hypothetical protein
MEELSRKKETKKDISKMPIAISFFQHGQKVFQSMRKKIGEENKS